MLSTPRSLGFVLAAILGAMLVPGCRSAGLSGSHSESDQPGHLGYVERNALGGLEAVVRKAESRPPSWPDNY